MVTILYNLCHYRAQLNLLLPLRGSVKLWVTDLLHSHRFQDLITVQHGFKKEKIKVADDSSTIKFYDHEKIFVLSQEIETIHACKEITNLDFPSTSEVWLWFLCLLFGWISVIVIPASLFTMNLLCGLVFINKPRNT